MGKSKQQLEEIAYRQNIVRKMILEENETNREEIRRRLEREHHIVVTHQTVVADFKTIAGNIPIEKIKEFHLDLLAIYRKRIHEFDKRISDVKDNSEWIRLTRAESMEMKDMGLVASNLSFIESGRNREQRKKEREDDGSIISFDEPIVSDDVDDKVDEDDIQEENTDGA